MADESGRAPMADEMERTALGIVMALERDDPAALRELFFTDDGPVDDLELIVTLGRLAAYLAGKLGAHEDPPVDAATVLARLALEWGRPAS
ncbi:MAG: hypothetical protein AB1679_32880 [Actinomycetota bacterium]